MFFIDYIFSLNFLYGVLGAIVVVGMIDVIFKLISYLYKNLENRYQAIN